MSTKWIKCITETRPELILVFKNSWAKKIPRAPIYNELAINQAIMDLGFGNCIDIINMIQESELSNTKSKPKLLPLSIPHNNIILLKINTGKISKITSKDIIS